MEILTRGQVPGNRVYTTTCTHCGCKFKFAESEATLQSGRNETWLEIICPEDGCGYCNAVEPKT